MRRVKRYYTIMFVSDDNSKPFSIRLHKNIIHTLILFAASVSLAVVVFVLYFGHIGLRLQLVDALRKDKERLTQEKARLIAGLQNSTKLEELSRYLEKIATETNPRAMHKPAVIAANISDTLAENAQQPVQGSKQNTKTVSAHQDESFNSYWATTPNIRPIDGWTTRLFQISNKASDETHCGIDIAASIGTPIRATAPGYVLDVVNDQFLGMLVIIKHKFGFVTRYGHCSQILVKKGDDIKRGQTIALCGNSGRSTAPHVHYEVVKDGKNVDPMIYILVGSKE